MLNENFCDWLMGGYRGAMMFPWSFICLPPPLPWSSTFIYQSLHQSVHFLSITPPRSEKLFVFVYHQHDFFLLPMSRSVIFFVYPNPKPKPQSAKIICLKTVCFWYTNLFCMLTPHRSSATHFVTGREGW